MCRCNRSLAVLCALFAGIAVATLIAEDRCLDAGGRLSDSAWICETASGTTASLWTLLNPTTIGLVVAAVGVPVFWVINAIGERRTVANGTQHG